MNPGIYLSEQEAEDLAHFIEQTLEQEWDRYTDRFICPDVSLDEGMQRMNPAMYDFREELLRRLSRPRPMRLVDEPQAGQ